MKPHSPSSETPQRRSTCRLKYRKSTKKYFDVRYPDYVFYSYKVPRGLDNEDGVTDKSADLRGNIRKHGSSTAKRSRCSPLAESDPGDSNIDVADLKKTRGRLKTTPPVTRCFCHSSETATSNYKNVGAKARKGSGRRTKNNCQNVTSDVNAVENSRNFTDYDLVFDTLDTTDSGCPKIVFNDCYSTIYEKCLSKNPVVKLTRLEDELIKCLKQSGFVSASRAMLLMGLTPCPTRTQTEVSEKLYFHSKEECKYSRSVNNIKPLLGFGSPENASTLVNYVRPNLHSKGKRSASDKFPNVIDLSCESSDDIVDNEKRLEIGLHDQRPTSKIDEDVITLSAIQPNNVTTKPNIRQSKQSLAKSRRQSVEKTDHAIEILDNDQESDAVSLLHSCQLPVPGHTVSEFSENRRAVEGFRSQYCDTIPVSSSREPSSSSDSENEPITGRFKNLMVQFSIINEVDEDLDSISLEPQDIRDMPGKVKHPPSNIESGDGCCRPEETKLNAFSNGGDLKLGVSSEKQRSRCPDMNTSHAIFHPSNQAENVTSEEKLSFCSGESGLLNTTSFSAKNPMPPSDGDGEEHQPQIRCEGAVEESGDSCKTAPIKHLLTSQEDSYRQNPCTEMIDIPKTIYEELPGQVPSNEGDGLSEPLELPTTPVESVVNPSKLSSSEVPSSLNDFSHQKGVHDRKEEPVGLSAVSLEIETTSESVCDVASNEEMNEISSDISVILEELSSLDGNPTATGRKNAQRPLNTSDIDENLIATTDPVVNEAGYQMTKSSLYELPSTKETNADQIQPRSPQLYANESYFDDESRVSTYESSSDNDELGNNCTKNQIIDSNENANDKVKPCDEVSRDCGSTSPVNESTGPDESPKQAESEAVSPAATVGNVDLVGGVVCQGPLNDESRLKNEFWHGLKHDRSSTSPAITRRRDRMNDDITFDKLTQPSLIETTQRWQFPRLLLEEISHITPTETTERPPLSNLSNEDCCISNELSVPSISGDEPILGDRLSSENGFPPPLCNSNENPTLGAKGISCDSPYQWRNDVAEETFHCSVENDSSSRKSSNSVQVPLSRNIWGKHLMAEYVDKKTPLATQVINEGLVKDYHSNSMETKVGGILANLVDIDNHLNQVEFRDKKNIFDVANSSFSENTFFPVEISDSYQDLVKKCSKGTPADFLEMSDYTEALVDACLRKNMPESSNGYTPSVHEVESADFPSVPHTDELPVETAWGSEQLTEASGVGASEEFGTECLDLPRSPTTCNPADLGDRNVSSSPNTTPNSPELIVDGVFHSTDEIHLPTEGVLNIVLSRRSSKSEKIPSTQLNDVNSTTNLVANIQRQPLLSAIQPEDVKPSSELIQPSSSQEIAIELGEDFADNLSYSKVDDLLFDEEFEQSNNVSPMKRTRVKKTVSPVPPEVVTSCSSELLFDEEFEFSNNTPVKKIKLGPSLTVTLLPRISTDLLFDEEFERSNNVTPAKNTIRGKRQLREPSPLTVHVTSCGLVNDLVIDENDEPSLNAIQQSVSDNEYPNSRNIAVGCLVISSDEESETSRTNNNPALNHTSCAKMVNRPFVRSLFKAETTLLSGRIAEKTKKSSTMSSPRIVVKTSGNPPLKQIAAIDRTLDEISHIDLSGTESVHSTPRVYIKEPVNTEGKAVDRLELKTSSLKGVQEANHCKQELSEKPSKSNLGLVTPIESAKVIPNDSTSRNKPPPVAETTPSIRTTALAQNSRYVIDLVDSDSEPSESEGFNVDPTCSILYSDSDLSISYIDDLLEDDDSFSSKNPAESCSSSNKVLTTKSLSTQRQSSQQQVKLAETIPQMKKANRKTSSKAQDMQNSKLVVSVREQSPESLSDRDFMDSEDSLWSSDEDTISSIDHLSSIQTISSTERFSSTTLLKSKLPKTSVLTSNHNIGDFFSSDEDDMPNRIMPLKRSQGELVAKRTSRVVAKSTVVSKNNTTSRTAVANSLKGTPPSSIVKSSLNDRENRGTNKPTRTSSVPLPSTRVLVPLRKLTSNSLTKSSVNSAAVDKRSQNDNLTSTSPLAQVQIVEGGGGSSVSSSSPLPGSSKEYQKISRKRAPMNLSGKTSRPISKHLSTSTATQVADTTSLTDDDICSLNDWDLTSSSDDDHGATKGGGASIPDFQVSQLVLSRQSLNFIKNLPSKQSKSKKPAAQLSKPGENQIPGPVGRTQNATKGKARRGRRIS